MLNNKIKTILETLPNTSGVYKFFNKKKEILYIGKASNLRSRVSSYFNDDISDRPWVQTMIPMIEDIKVIETNNEIEALVLESALIKEYEPKYNSDLKDDKSYAWIYIPTSDEFPTVKIVRSIKKGEYKKGELFGPYPKGIAVKRVFTYLRKLYPFCTCTKIDQKPCLYFDIGLCPGPYHGKISKEEYRKNIDNIIKFLKGGKKSHIKDLEKEMMVYAQNKEYEKAGELRDKINDLRYLGEKINFTYYDNTQEYKSSRQQTRIQSNDEIKIQTNLKSDTLRIECYDISNMQGKDAYGSMVVSESGVLKRNEYRIFKIRGSDTPDDPGMLREVLERRLKHIDISEDDSLRSKPDIILIDGALSQLSVVKRFVPRNITLLGISKGKHLKREGKKKKDEYWIRRGDVILSLDVLSPELLIDLRDEAHRFAISHYRREALRGSKYSKLDSIKGVGTKRRKELLKVFGSVDGISKASVEDINKVVKNINISKDIKKDLVHPKV